MSFILTKNSGVPVKYLVEGYIENTSDLSNLGTNFTLGSKIYALDTGKAYVLGSNGSWEYLKEGGISPEDLDDYYTKEEVNNLIETQVDGRFVVADALPIENIQTNVIYLIPSEDPGVQNIRNEYINLTGTLAGWELIGSTQINLSDYYTKAESDTRFVTNALLVDNAAKNLLLLTLEGVKKASESDDGTWHDNVYTENGINFAIATDDVERVISITVSQTAGAATGSLSLVPSTIDPETLDIIYDPTYSAGNYIFSVGGNLPEGVDLVVSYEGTSGSMMQYVHDEAEITLAEGSGCLVGIYVRSITIESGEPVIFDDFVIHPMFRRAGTSADFETGYRTQKQLDAALASVQNGLASKLDKTGGAVTGQITTNQTTFDNDQQLVTKKYVDDNVGTASYNDLTNKPSINNVILTGNKTLNDLGIGGHDNYTETILWENEGTTNPASINLPDSIKNYDMVAMRTLLANDIAPMYLTIPVDQLYADSAFICFNNAAGNLMGTFNTDGTVYTTHNASLSSRMILGQIVGIRLGARKPYKETVLYNGGTTANVGEITLSQNALNFDLIVALFSKADGSSFTNIIVSGEPSILNDNGWQQEYGPVGWYISNGGLTFGWNNGNAMYPRKIIGISYGGSVKGRNVTSLFANGGSTNPESITLSSAYTDFDEIVVYARQTNNPTLAERFILSNTLKVNDYMGLQSGNTYLNYLVASTASFTFINASDLVISGIYGIKYDSDYITIDSEMSSTSENPVQNKVVKEYVDNAIAAITDYEEEVFPNG